MARVGRSQEKVESELESELGPQLEPGPLYTCEHASRSFLAGPKNSFNTPRFHVLLGGRGLVNAGCRAHVLLINHASIIVL